MSDSYNLCNLYRQVADKRKNVKVERKILIDKYHNLEKLGYDDFKDVDSLNYVSLLTEYNMAREKIRVSLLTEIDVLNDELCSIKVNGNGYYCPVCKIDKIKSVFCENCGSKIINKSLRSIDICKKIDIKQVKLENEMKAKKISDKIIRRDKITSILTSPKNGEDDTLLLSVSGIYYIIIWTILLCSVKSSPLMVIYTILSILVCWFIVTEHLRVFAYFIDSILIILWVLLWGGPCIVTWMVVLSGFEIVRICILESDKTFL